MKETKEYIEFNELSNLGVINLFTTKEFNFNNANLGQEVIDNEYNKLQELIGYKFIKIKKPIQTHSNIVKKVDSSNIDDIFDNVDGLVTNLKGVALATSLADCQGILLYDDNKKVIGNIHSGWKGTLNRIIVNEIELMINEYGSSPSDIKAFICPSILKCCFEVDEDVRNLYVENFKDIDINKYIITKGNKYMIDTVGINVEIIKRLGIPENNITTSNICTKCNNDKYHSHRGDKELDGRNIALIAMK